MIVDTDKVPVIARIEIQDLFGEFSYDISPSSSETQLPLVILYGDNGSGKTTILNLLFHLLSPEPYAGHRTAIGETLFRRFSLTLGSGHIITASRTNSYQPGPYLLSISLDGKTLSEYNWVPGRGRGDEDSAEELLYKETCETLEAIGVTVHFLSDSRKVLSFQQRRSRRQTQNERLMRTTIEGRLFYVNEEQEESWLQKTIKDALESVRTVAMAGTNRGYESANVIYEDIVRSLVTYETQANPPAANARQRLQDRLKLLVERNSSYSRLGLTPPLDVTEIVGLVGKAGESLATVDRVLSPYLDGVKARLDALEDAQRLITAFSSLLTDFYHGKTVQMHLKSGISIQTRSGKPLSPEHLSSGEQQLMLLMCNAISARGGKSAVFAIDEPELSLNVKWQRKLIDALLECLNGTNCQLLLATHSMQLLAKYRHQVVHLSDDGQENALDG